MKADNHRSDLLHHLGNPFRRQHLALLSQRGRRLPSSHRFDCGRRGNGQATVLFEVFHTCGARIQGRDCIRVFIETIQLHCYNQRQNRL